MTTLEVQKSCLHVEQALQEIKYCKHLAVDFSADLEGCIYEKGQ